MDPRMGIQELLARRPRPAPKQEINVVGVCWSTVTLRRGYWGLCPASGPIPPGITHPLPEGCPPRPGCETPEAYTAEPAPTPTSIPGDIGPDAGQSPQYPAKYPPPLFQWG
jgi:hypothetical protein